MVRTGDSWQRNLRGQTISRLTVFRLALAFAAVYLLSITRTTSVDPLGVLLLLVGALAYALQLVIGQRVLYDIPAPTMTLTKPACAFDGSGRAINQFVVW